MAKLIDTDFAYLSRLENDRVDFRPSVDFLNRIVDKLECSEEEKESLFSEARRLDAATEHAVDEIYQRPALKALFRTAPKLSDDELIKLNREIDEILDQKE